MQDRGRASRNLMRDRLRSAAGRATPVLGAGVPAARGAPSVGGGADLLAALSPPAPAEPGRSAVRARRHPSVPALARRAPAVATGPDDHAGAGLDRRRPD